ncbi:MAG: aminotransferase class I/II-fold pyridoxal phosphate-dependent enzyme [Woeseiaceae bacterium]|nr:aminotransferase class I/II-fold pyridoxal phosphate-dependent enzyme [Woeseiaceae bacterium]
MTPPTFSMYSVYADMQSAGVIEVPLAAGGGFTPDVAQILERCQPSTKLIFLCSPNNPTGNLVAPSDLERLLRARRDRSMIVVDEAYIEFSDAQSAAGWLNRFDNLVVLRTLSKAYALAGARCGAIIAATPVIDLLAPMLPPYAFSAPTTATVLEALSDDGLATAATMIARTRIERERVSAALASLECIAHVWPSAANFILVRFADPDAAERHLAESGILVRTYDDKPALEDCARITIGEPAENDRLLAALAAVPEVVT